MASAAQTALALHLMYPLDFVAFSRGFTSTHKGVDIAWNYDHGGPNMPVYAPADGTVYLAKDGMDNTYKTGKPDYGNYVMIQHAPGVWTLSGHLLKGSVCVKKGQKVKRGQQVGNMGNSGYSDGPHDHFEVYLNDTYDSNRVDPVDYVYAWPHQAVHAGDKKKYGIKTYTPIEEVGHPVERNIYVDQMQVITDTLNARKEPNLKGDLLGYVKPGIYNIYGMTEADGYKWYQPEDFWCANDKTETWCKIMKTDYYGKPIPRNEKVNQIEVTATTLRARSEPSLTCDVHGYATPGFYNCDATDTNEGYKWFKANDGVNVFWVAQSKKGDWVNYLPLKETKYDLTMFALNEAQKKAMTVWCEAEGVNYVVSEN